MRPCESIAPPKARQGATRNITEKSKFSKFGAFLESQDQNWIVSGGTPTRTEEWAILIEAPGKMREHNLITVSASGAINHYTPPQTTPHKAVTAAAPETLSKTLPLLLHQKSSITHPSTHTRHPTPPITALASAPPLLITGDKEGFVYLHYPGQSSSRHALHIAEVTQIAVCDAGETLITSSVDGCVHLSPLHAPSPVVTLRHPLPVTAFTLGYAGVTGRLVTACADRCIRVWHAASGRCLSTLRHEARVTALAGSVDEDFAWGDARGCTGYVRVGELPVGGVVQVRVQARREGELGVGVGAVVLSPEGMVVGYDDGVVRVYDAGSGVLLRAFGGGARVVGLFVDTGRADELGGLFAEGIVVGGVGKDAWQAVSEVGKELFENNEAEKGDVDAVGKEVLWLRRRNGELEEAGRRLIDLVERG